MNETIPTSQLEKLEFVRRHARIKLISAIIVIPAFGCLFSSMPVMFLLRRVPNLAAYSDEVSACMMVLAFVMMVAGTILGYQDLGMMRDASRNLDKRILPVLLEMFKRKTAMSKFIFFDNRRSVDPLASMGGLTYLLAQILLKVEEDDSILVNASGHVVLRSILSLQNPSLSLGALQAIGAIGDREDLLAVRDFIDTGADIRFNVHDEANTAMTAVRARLLKCIPTADLMDAISESVPRTALDRDGARLDSTGSTASKSSRDTSAFLRRSTLLRALDSIATILTICFTVSFGIILCVAQNTGRISDAGVYALMGATFAGICTGSIRSSRRQLLLQERPSVTRDKSNIGLLLDEYDTFRREGRFSGLNSRGLLSQLQESIRIASENLVQTLPKIQDSDGIRLTPHQHAVLRGILSNTNQYLVSGALHALSVLGNGDDLAAIEAFIRDTSESEPWHVQNAEAAAAVIRMRIASVDAVSTLVRSSSMPEAMSDELVRAVTLDKPETHPRSC